MSAATDPASHSSCPIVGVGASAGGLETFTQLLQCLPATTGLAFVLIQHLDPNHPSLLSEALAKVTAMPVRQVESGVQVEANHVYVVPPNADIAYRDGQLVLSARRTDGAKPYLPINLFLRSLAAALGNRSIGVILSGTGSDGTEGLRAIHEADGITFAQDPLSAKFDGMPHSAIEAGVVDHCLDIPQLAAELARLSAHAYERRPEPTPAIADETARARILARMRAVVGIDFSEFKQPTVQRRLARRLALRGVANLPAYAALLETNADEVRSLYEDMLIHVTSFFRDPEVFTSLREHAFPELLKSKADGATVRVWVAGCATGEEVYSLAIALLEFLAGVPGSHPIQIFGSDVSELAIQKARSGVYSDSAMRDVSDERRKRYFSRVDGAYRINRSVRDLCVFVRHDLARDPPFSKLDLVSCRNVLIYFDQALQKKVVPILHYCLNQPGFLVLGHSENVSGFSQLFVPADKTNKIFMRSTAASSLRFAPRTELVPAAGRVQGPAYAGFPQPSATLTKHLDRLLLARYCPPGVLVKENLDVLLFRGQTGSYLQPAPGEPQNNLIGMARGGLISALRATIAQAKQDMTVVTNAGVEVDQTGSTKTCDVVVMPFSGLPESKEPLFVVLFEEPKLGTQLQPATNAARLAPADAGSTADLRRIVRLEHELASTQEYLHTLVEEHGRANDELGASNEELVSGNEELQSMNEELETAKEELQSINEELTTVNEELHTRNQEVTRVNGDLMNFSLTVDMPILSLDMNRRIRRFTPNARNILNVLPSDVGRSIDDIKLNIDVPDLHQQISQVIEQATVKESEVQDRDGHWYRMQLRPYVTADHGVDGVILSLMDIDALKQLVKQAQDARAEAERANIAKDDFLATLSHELRTPLSSMLLNAQLLKDGHVVAPADLQRAGAALERATRTQAQLVDDLLDVSRIVAGKLVLECQRVDLCDVVRVALDSVSLLSEARALVLTLSLEPGLGAIWADPLRVQQVVSNLLTNAIKFTPHGGQVSIAVDAAEGFARLRVTDTGIGIQPEFLPRVFARFSQSDTSITRTHGGLGLGLALVRHLVEMHGGSVLAQSDGAGRGATFSVTFPLARVSARPGAALGSVAPLGHALDRPGHTRPYAALANLRVLFVDDDLRTREAVLEVLELAGARVQLAASAAEGRAAIESFKPDVILSDIAMPGEDGYTFMRKLRAREAGRTPIPALALTALAAEDDRRRTLAAGFQLHLAKPIDIDRLRDGVLELSKLARPTAPQPPPAPAIDIA